MRFLLHPTTQRATSQGIIGRGRGAKNIKESLPKASDAVRVTSTKKSAGIPSNQQNDTYVQSWGQQCSPNCGCVVRFEAQIDPNTNKFTSASYHAKSLVVTPTKCEDNKVKPVMTFRNNKPMFKSCSCPSLHKLSSEIADYLPNKDLLAFGSSMEFAGVRSSPAFRHTVLEKQGLSTSDTHCFDVVEEALTAMVKGHMPKSRAQITPKEIYGQAISASAAAAAAGAGPNAKQREDYQLKIDMRAFWEPPRAMSALQLMDGTAKYSPFGFLDRDQHHHDDHYNYYNNNSQSNIGGSADDDSSSLKSYDWVTYVDELYAEKSA